jgi:hypothetical protein
MVSAMAKQAFSSFDYETALKALAIERLLPWTLPIQELTPTDFFLAVSPFAASL